MKKTALSPKPEDLQALVFGHNDEPGLVAVEPVRGGEEMLLYVRRGQKTVAEREPFQPFLWLESADLLEDGPAPSEVAELKGSNPLRFLATFGSWKDLDRCVARLKKSTGATPTAPDAPYLLLNDPVQQHLMRTGRTLFKGMEFADLRRLQVDIETRTTPGFDFPNAEREDDRILAIALADSSGWAEVLSGAEMDEKTLLERFAAEVRARDPDVIEGHNLFKFDLPYLFERARRHRVKLALGRDGSEPAVRPSRFVTADRTLSYPRTEIHGRHVVDTFFLAQIHDVTHRELEGFGLKEVAAHFGLSAPDRTYLDGREIAEVFERDPKRVIAYARDDVVETRALAGLLSPVFFAQARMLPFAYQTVCIRGAAAKIDALLLRAYLRAGRAVARPDFARPFAGGYTDLFLRGRYEDVHHCDVRSLYPSLMLQQRMAPRTDDLGVFLQLLEHLRAVRLAAARLRRTGRTEQERQRAEAEQAVYKVLINSFYGYLGFRQARFSDFTAAERVAAEGRALLRRLIERLRELGAQPIEIDTDGVYFLPPQPIGDLDAFRADVRAALPEGIELEFDGIFPAMFSYKMKNYALLTERGEILIKGAALKSRGLEPFQRDFLRERLRLLLEGRDAEAPALLAQYRQAIEQRTWPIRTLAKTEVLSDSPATYQAKISRGGRGRNAAFELALRSGRDYRAGDAISYYVAGDKPRVAVHAAARLVADWDPEQRDENVPYYLAKLEALSRKFDGLLQDEAVDSDEPEEAEQTDEA